MWHYGMTSLSLPWATSLHKSQTASIWLILDFALTWSFFKNSVQIQPIRMFTGTWSTDKWYFAPLFFYFSKSGEGLGLVCVGIEGESQDREASDTVRRQSHDHGASAVYQAVRWCVRTCACVCVCVTVMLHWVRVINSKHPTPLLLTAC